MAEWMGMRRSMKRRIMTGAALGLVLPSFAWAQDAPEEEPQEVIVTGSQIARTGFDTPTPVTVVGIADLDRVAAPNIADALNQYPALKPSVTPEA